MTPPTRTLTNLRSRPTERLDGPWRAIVDPYDFGYLDIFGRPKPAGLPPGPQAPPRGRSGGVRLRHLARTDRSRRLEHPVPRTALLRGHGLVPAPDRDRRARDGAGLPPRGGGQPHHPGLPRRPGAGLPRGRLRPVRRGADGAPRHRQPLPGADGRQPSPARADPGPAGRLVELRGHHPLGGTGAGARHLPGRRLDHHGPRRPHRGRGAGGRAGRRGRGPHGDGVALPDQDIELAISTESGGRQGPRPGAGSSSTAPGSSAGIRDAPCSTRCGSGWRWGTGPSMGSRTRSASARCGSRAPTSWSTIRSCSCGASPSMPRAPVGVDGPMATTMPPPSLAGPAIWRPTSCGWPTISTTRPWCGPPTGSACWPGARCRSTGASTSPTPRPWPTGWTSCPS